MLISARLEYIIFENKTNHYIVAGFIESGTHHTFTGAGRIEDAQEDQEYNLEGDYVKHPKYGDQFRIDIARKKLPDHSDSIIHFLSGDNFPTIGKKTATQIYETLGEDCLEKIHDDITLLNQIPSLTPAKKKIIEKGINEFTGFNETYVNLLKYGLSPRQIQMLEDKYENVLEVIQEDCFKPYYEVFGFGYKAACKLATAIDLDPNDTRRLDAYIYELSRQLSMSTGNTYITLATLLERTNNLDPNIIQESLERLSNQEYLYIENTKIYPFTLHEDEITIAKEIAHHTFEVDKVDVNDEIKKVEFNLAISYDDEQKQAIQTFFENSFMILNGGPGTGKTTTVKGILMIVKKLYPESIIQLCAPTGRASKRLGQLSNCDSRTIHSLLQWNLEDNSFGKDENDPLDIDFLIVDEFSMVDTHLFAQLLKALPYHCRILLIGDEDQLESVGPGKVLEDLIKSKVCPITHLQKIFRQANGSGIVTLAKEIRDEETCTYDDGVEFIERTSPKIMDTLIDLIKDKDLNNMQILAPMYKGVAGIDAINNQMQVLFNPKSPQKSQIKVGTTIFRENDKVMLLKNLPDDDVYNGDIGTILEINPKENIITVDFLTTIVDFTQDFLYYLTHAWCISVHKSQGNEYQDVFMIVDPSAKYMLEKRLLYTAVSRAKKNLYLIGNKALFEQQVKLKQTRIRQTTLKEKIDAYNK
jgi:exodeoxyribonuclease V alpha subunit